MAMRSPLMIAGSSYMSDENGGEKVNLKAEAISNSHPEKIMNGLGTCSQTSKGSLKISTSLKRNINMVAYLHVSTLAIDAQLNV